MTVNGRGPFRFAIDTGQPFAVSVTSAAMKGTNMLDLDVPERDGSCHCGAVRFRARLTDGLRTARRCDCSFCRMRGAVAVSADLHGIDILQGEECLATYRFNTGTALHFFCSICGIYTHHQRRSNPSQYGVNVACLESVSPFDFPSVPVNDGVHHPSDAPAGSAPRLAGTLTFKPSSGE